MGKVLNPNTMNTDLFGSAVAISNDYAILGSKFSDENGMNDVGSCTIYKKYDDIWMPHQKFSYPHQFVNSYFGSAVGLDPTSNRFLVGAIGYQSYKGAGFFGKIK